MIAIYAAACLALFGIACYWFAHAVLAEVEAERIELKDMHCTGRWL